MRGSIIDMAGAVLTESDKAKIRAQFETATHVGAVKLAGLNAWAPFKGEAVSRYIGELQADGLIKEARDSKGKFAGWQLATDDE